MQRLNLFAGLAQEEIEALAGRLHDRVLKKRQIILDPESRGDRIYLIKTGAVRVYQVSSDGRELTTAILRPGQLLGTAALAGRSQSGAFAEALEPQTCVCDATADEFLRMMSAHPVLAAKVMVTLARQAVRLEQQLEQLAFREVPVRLAQALIQLAEDNSGELPSSITHESLAKLIGSTRETVSKPPASLPIRDWSSSAIAESGFWTGRACTRSWHAKAPTNWPESYALRPVFGGGVGRAPPAVQ